MKQKILNIIFVTFLLFQICLFVYVKLAYNVSVGVVPVLLSIILPSLAMLASISNKRKTGNNLTDNLLDKHC